VRWDLFFVIHLMDQHVYYSWDYSPTLQSYSKSFLRTTSTKISECLTLIYFWNLKVFVISLS